MDNIIYFALQAVNTLLMAHFNLKHNSVPNNLLMGGVVNQLSISELFSPSWLLCDDDDVLAGGRSHLSW